MYGGSCVLCLLVLFQTIIIVYIACFIKQVLADLHSRGARSFGDLKPENIIMAGKKLVLIDWCSSRDTAQGDSCYCNIPAQLRLAVRQCASLIALLH